MSHVHGLFRIFLVGPSYVYHRDSCRLRSILCISYRNYFYPYRSKSIQLISNSFLIFFFLAALCLRCCTRAFSSCSKWGLLFVVVRSLFIAVASLVAEHGLQACGLQQLWHVGSVVVARRLQRAGSVVVAHGLSCSVACGISQTRARTRVPCVGRRILNHCVTREVPDQQLFTEVILNDLPLYHDFQA